MIVQDSPLAISYIGHRQDEENAPSQRYSEEWYKNCSLGLLGREMHLLKVHRQQVTQVKKGNEYGNYYI
jgi:hypothetical protein